MREGIIKIDSSIYVYLDLVVDQWSASQKKKSWSMIIKTMKSGHALISFILSFDELLLKWTLRSYI